jgi:hypothetical protein
LKYLNISYRFRRVLIYLWFARLYGSNDIYTVYTLLMLLFVLTCVYCMFKMLCFMHHRYRALTCT